MCFAPLLNIYWSCIVSFHISVFDKGGKVFFLGGGGVGGGKIEDGLLLSLVWLSWKVVGSSRSDGYSPSRPIMFNLLKMGGKKDKNIMYGRFDSNQQEDVKENLKQDA